MDRQRSRTRQADSTSNGLGGFKLPPDVSTEKQQLPYGWAFVFRHRTLGELGRIVLQETDDGRTHLSCEVVGDPTDHKTAERAAIFQPLGLELSRRMAVATGAPPNEDAGWIDPPRRSPEPTELVESRLLPCGQCDRWVAMLIFAPHASDEGRFEDYARKMYPEYTLQNVPTWIIGPALGGGPLMDRPADMLKVWPAREPMFRQRPAEFNAMLDLLAREHCSSKPEL